MQRMKKKSGQSCAIVLLILDGMHAVGIVLDERFLIIFKGYLPLRLENEYFYIIKVHKWVSLDILLDIRLKIQIFMYFSKTSTKLPKCQATNYIPNSETHHHHRKTDN